MSGPSRPNQASGQPGEFGATTLSGATAASSTARTGTAFRSGTATAPAAAPAGSATGAGRPGAPGANVASPGPAPRQQQSAQPRARGPRRARLQLRNVSPLTVLKFSSVLSIALFFVWLIMIGVLYAVLDGAGVIGQINDTIQTINGNTSTPLITPKVVFGGAAIIGAINMVLFVALTTIGSVVYNLCADLVGGVEITLSER